MKPSNRKQTKQAGFSLIELLAVVVITALLSLVTVQILLTSQLRGSEAASTGRIRQEGNFILDQITFAIRNAREADCVSSTVLNVDSKNGTILTYTLNGTNLASNSSQLSSGDVLVTNLAFACEQTSDAAGALVNISFTLTPSKGDQNLTQDFATSTAVRSH